MRDVRLVGLVGVFSIWWLVSAVNQVRTGAWTWRLRRHVPLGLIPLWTFFAPNPARADPRLVWREEVDDEWESVRELHFGFAPIASRWLINPQLILNKAVADLVRSLLSHDVDRDGRTLLLSPAYLTVLSIVLSQPRRPGCKSVQFAIVRTSGPPVARRLETVFLSEVHSTGEAVECSPALA